MSSMQAAVLVLLAVLSPLRAQEPAPKGATYALSDLVTLALKASPLLGAQDARVEEARRAAAQARVWPGPSAEFLVGRKTSGEAGGPRFELSAAQPLPVTGKTGLRGELLGLEADARAAQRTGAEVSVSLAVVQGAYEYSANRRKAAFTDKRRKRFEIIESYLSGRVFPTPQRRAESRIVQNRLKAVAAEAVQSEAGYKASLEKLKAYAPLPSGSYPEVDLRWFSGAGALDEREWLEKALTGNPELRVRRLGVTSAGLEKSLASREGLPDAALVASYERSKAGETEKNYGLGLSLSFPTWNANRSGIRSAEQKRLSEERQLAFDERKLRSEVTRALVEYEAARQTVRLYPREKLDELDTQLADADEGFRKGQVDLLTFLELDGSAAETVARAFDAQADLAAKASELLALTADRDALAKLASF